MRSLLPLILLILAGCAHRPLVITGPGSEEAPKTVVNPDAMRIVGGDDDLTGLDGYDAPDLFRLGFAAFEADDYARALALYERLLTEFPEHEDVLPATWNLALCGEKLGDLDAADRGYGEYALRVGDPVEVAEATVRRALILQRLDRHDETVPLLEAALEEQGLAPEIRWEAEILHAMTRAAKGSFDLAETRLEHVRREIRQTTIRERERFPWQSAMVWYMAGELYRLRARAIPLDAVDDLPRLDANVRDKALLLLEARQHFKRTLRHGAASWSGAASLGLGTVYENFRDDLLAAPVPADLEPEVAKAYEDLLTQRTRQFLEKAVSDYREVLASAEALRLEPAWVTAVEAALDRCEAQLGTGIRADLSETGAPAGG